MNILKSSHTLTLISFFIGSIVIVLFSITLEDIKSHKVNTTLEKIDSKLEITGVSFYYTVENKPHMKLDALGLVNINDSFSIFKSPKGEILAEGKAPISFIADEANFDADEDLINFNGHVHINNSDFELDAANISINLETDKYEASGSIQTILNDTKTKDKIHVKSQYFEGYPSRKYMEFTGKVTGELKRKRVYEKGFKFQTEKMTANLIKSRLYMDHSVRFLIDSLDATAGRAEILLQNRNKTLKYYSLYDDIELEQKVVLKNKTFIRKAKAEKLVGLLSQGQIVLSGAPRVFQDNDIIKGYEIILRKNLEMIEVEQSKSKFSIKE